jgi:light-regulated signal transduction histidine kinase (bacteriophytochrome)
MEYKPEKFSPLPIVNLANIKCPSTGWALPRTSYCSKKFNQGETCKAFYEGLASSGTINKMVQCPFGFSTFPFSLAGRPFAFTCLIPFPRQGGTEEKERAKSHPETKISTENVLEFAKHMDAGERDRLNLVDEGLKSYPSALHEIRKFNRTIKQEAERLCREQSPQDPDSADPRLVSIFKCSELMTFQFEILELIANQSLVTLPMNCNSEVYKIFDKCVRILRYSASKKDVSLRIEGDSPRARVNDKTFHIIATVLLENAIKYSAQGTEIIVRLQRLSADQCRVSVNNIAPHVAVLPDIFEKGVRGNDDGTGMGYGLFLAQQVARQHSTLIKCERRPYINGFDNYIFSFDLRTV